MESIVVQENGAHAIYLMDHKVGFTQCDGRKDYILAWVGETVSLVVKFSRVFQDGNRTETIESINIMLTSINSKVIFPFPLLIEQGIIALGGT